MLTVQKMLLLRKVDLFQGLSTRELGRIARRTREMTVVAGTDIIREGETGQRLYVVASGRIAVARGGRRFAELGPTDYFGEISVLTVAAVTATISADTDSLLLCIDQRDFHDVLANNFDAVLVVIQTLCKRLGELGGLKEFSAADDKAKR